MKRTIILLILIGFFVVSSCKDETISTGNNQYKSTGLITHADFRECMCCGGWFIKIDTNTYRFYNLPDSSNMNLDKETLPLQVELDWKFPVSPCMDDLITVIRIRKK